MSTASDLNLLDFNVNSLSGSCWEGQFKSHPCYLRGSCPIYQFWTVSVLPVPVGGSDSLSPAVFWPCRPSGTLQVSQAEFESGGRGLPRGVLSDPWHQSCWHSTHAGCCLVFAQVCDSEGEQPAPCWLQESLHQQTYQLLCIFFFFSHVLKLPTAMPGCSYWHFHDHVGAVSLVMHKGGICGINTTVVVLGACRSGAK